MRGMNVLKRWLFGCFFGLALPFDINSSTDKGQEVKLWLDKLYGAVD